jgi:DNA polymerase-1
VQQYLDRERLATRLILQVHDELVLEAPVGRREEIESLTRTEMESVHPMSVPLRVDVSRGPNWADLS